MANFDQTWEIRIEHRARHSVRPRRNFWRWVGSALREIGDALADPFRGPDWLPG